MSNALQYDAFLVSYLARELRERLQGRQCAAVPHLGGGTQAVLPFVDGFALHLDLHPSRGWLRVVPWERTGIDDEAVCDAVEAPPDERLLRIRLRATGRFQSAVRCLVLELHTNQWNAVLLDDADQRILAVLRPRSAGERELFAGRAYRPPPPVRRVGIADREAARDAWTRTLGAVVPAERRGALIRHFAYTGSINADAVLGEAARLDAPQALDAAWERWVRLAGLPPARPVVLQRRRGAQPYPVPLPGVEARPADSLLEAMRAVADAPIEREAEAADDPALVRWLARKREAAARKVESIEAQRGRAGEVERLRTRADLLLARLHTVPRGAERVVLDGWDGEPVEIRMDPALEPAENAERLYRQARRLSRAEAQIPQLLESAGQQLQRWRAATRAVAEGEPLPQWAAELRERERSAAEAADRYDETVPPYRSYRTSGGLEVRVGRSARDNDRVTFHHSAPQDVWLHARQVPGSHVILRWTDAEGAPPARDLAEAAGLAAWFSKARTSGLVAVDWTRRKYVRKPRGAPPGAVVPQRVKTLFVEPDEALEARLREE